MLSKNVNNKKDAKMQNNVPKLELVSKELNHLAAILHYYARSFICFFVDQSQLERANLKLLIFLFMVNCFCV